jgi:UDP-N-acetylmuramoylalanine--D-glutamate ligase
VSSSVGEWTGQNIIVLGLARSGVAVAKLLSRLGARVTVNDRKPRSECPEAAELEQLGIPVICGGHPEDLIGDHIDLLVKNPGIPYHVPLVQQALSRNIPVVTEVEIAWRITNSPIAAITGSNGKTTTTTLVGEMLQAGGVKARVAGNIGKALTEVVEELAADEWLVAELSSFQLKGTERFRPRVGALLNVVSAHLDYHKNMSDYVCSKSKLFQNQTAQDIAVLNWDSDTCRKVAETVPGEIWWFSRRERVDRGVDVEEGWITLRLPGAEDQRLMPADEVALPGAFNLENALAAAAVAWGCGCPAKAIRETLSSFTGVEHRMEFVREVNGIRFYNNSKATNAEATMGALQAFDSPIVLVAGGLDRGVDFRELLPLFRSRLKGIVTYGQAGPVLMERAKEAEVPLRETAEGVAEAAQKAARLAEAGDVVLLSPACASWDMYTSFEERGRIFKQAVHSL